MLGRVFLIHWNRAEAEALAQGFRLKGWIVEFEAEDGARAGKRIKENPPCAVIIYLTRLPSHGRETADYLRSVKATREIPILFVDGKAEAVEKTRTKIPGAIFTSSEEIGNLLPKFVREG